MTLADVEAAAHAHSAAVITCQLIAERVLRAGMVEVGADVVVLSRVHKWNHSIEWAEARGQRLHVDFTSDSWAAVEYLSETPLAAHVLRPYTYRVVVDDLPAGEAGLDALVSADHEKDRTGDLLRALVLAELNDITSGGTVTTRVQGTRLEAIGATGPDGSPLGEDVRERVHMVVRNMPARLLDLADPVEHAVSFADRPAGPPQKDRFIDRLRARA